MSNENYGCELTVPDDDGNREVVLLLADVEQQFLGLSLTERDGLGMRRIAVELHDMEQITKLRNSLDAYLLRQVQ